MQFLQEHSIQNYFSSEISTKFFNKPQKALFLADFLNVFVAKNFFPKIHIYHAQLPLGFYYVKIRKKLMIQFQKNPHAQRMEGLMER